MTNKSSDYIVIVSDTKTVQKTSGKAPRKTRGNALRKTIRKTRRKPNLKLPRGGKNKRLTKLLNDPPLLVSVKDAQDLVGYKRSKLFNMLADGTLQRVKSGNSTRVTMKSIMAFVEGK